MIDLLSVQNKKYILYDINVFFLLNIPPYQQFNNDKEKAAVQIKETIHFHKNYGKHVINIPFTFTLHNYQVTYFITKIRKLNGM